MRRFTVLFLTTSATLVLAASLSRCASYAIESSINEAAYYRARYIERCVTRREPSVPCQPWALAQRRLDAAVGEASDAMKTGGRQALQVAALHRQLAAVRKEFGKWLE